MMRRFGGFDAAPLADDDPKLGRRELAILGPFLRPHLWRSVYATALLLAGQLSTLIAPLLLKYGIDQGIRRHDTHALDLAAGALLASTLFAWLTQRRTIVVSGEVGESALRSIRIKVFDH